MELDELFFSTTDRRGIIRSGNSVFVRISQYDLQELVGAPHNIIRHPDMPSGAFELMWQRLLDGRPMGAYVQNMAADGGTYWVFATVTPLGEGFLSVRSAPCAAAFEVVRHVYRAARAEEERSATAGHHRADVARVGLQFLQQQVATLGYDSYESFMFDTMMSEVSARRELLGPLSWTRPWATGPAADLLTTTVELDGALGHLGERMSQYRALATRLGPASSAVLGSATSLTAAADHAVAASDASGKKVLSNTARVMRDPMDGAVASLTALAPQLDAALRAAREAGFLIALAQLHAEMIVRFAIEVIDGIAPNGSSLEVGQLCDALHDDVRAMVTVVNGFTSTLRDVAGHVDAAAADYDTFGRFLAEWSRLAIRHLDDGGLSGAVGPVDREFANGRTQLRALHDLAGECRDAAVPIEVASFDAHLDRMQSAAATFAPGAFPPPTSG